MHRFVEKYVVICRVHLGAQQIWLHERISWVNPVGFDDESTQRFNQVNYSLITRHFSDYKVESVISPRWTKTYDPILPVVLIGKEYTS